MREQYLCEGIHIGKRCTISYDSRLDPIKGPPITLFCALARANYTLVRSTRLFEHFVLMGTNCGHPFARFPCTNYKQSHRYLCRTHSARPVELEP